VGVEVPEQDLAAIGAKAYGSLSLTGVSLFGHCGGAGGVADCTGCFQAPECTEVGQDQVAGNAHK
jgi:hypothetical protein